MAGIIDTVNKGIGWVVAWLALLMVLIQMTVVVLRYVFGYGSIWMQESIIYMHAMLFMLGAAATLINDGHVRVDIFYRNAAPKKKALVDLVGALFVLSPVCILIIWYSLPYAEKSWEVFEGSKETSGIQAVFLLKSLIPVFAIMMLLQGISMSLRCLCRLLGPADKNLVVEG